MLKKTARLVKRYIPYRQYHLHPHHPYHHHHHNNLNLPQPGQRSLLKVLPHHLKSTFVWTCVFNSWIIICLKHLMLQPANVEDDFRIHNLVPCYRRRVWLAGVVVGWRVLSSEIPALNNLCQSMFSNTIPEISYIK